jgi:inorganic phosphate transporter, PiT family
MVSDVILGLGVILAFVFGWNNSSFLIGNAEGSGSLTLREALIVSSAGLLLGVVLEGSQMLKSLSGSITPVVGSEVVIVALGVSLGMTIVLSVAKLPVSFSMAIVGAFAGAAFGSSLPINGARLEDMVAFWFVSPLLAAVLAYLFYKIILKSASRLSLLAVDGASRYGVIITSLIIAYVLGANNVGLIYGVTLNGAPVSESLLLVLVIVAVVGMVALGRGGISGTIGDRLLALSPFGVIATFLSSAVLIWTGTELAIPISISQCLLGGMFGAAFTKHSSAINGRLAAESISMWVVVPVAAFLLGFLLIQL